MGSLCAEAKHVQVHKTRDAAFGSLERRFCYPDGEEVPMKASKILKGHQSPRASQHLNRKSSHSHSATSYYKKGLDCLWEGFLYLSRLTKAGELLLS